MAAPQHTAPSLDAALKRMGDTMLRMQRRIDQLERNQRASQLGNSTINNGALQVVDGAGNTALTVGKQTDGTFAVAAASTAAPGVPSDPQVLPSINSLLVSWDGTMNDDSYPLSDFVGVQVHVSQEATFTPGPDTLQGQMPGQGLFAVHNLDSQVEYFVALVAITLSGVTGAPSTIVPGTPADVASLILPNSIEAGMVNFAASAIGGPTVYILGFPPSDPKPGDLWYDATNGYLLQQWNGSAWVPYQFGTNAIQAGSVTAALIAANTITATQIAAGTITAGQIAAATIIGSNIAANTITAANIAAGTITATEIAASIILAGAVDGTTITGAQLIADGTSGVLLAYGGAPTTGNLVAAISPVAGTDGHSNAYTAGLTIVQGQLVLANSATPSASAIGPVVFGQSNGHLQVVDGGDGSLYDTQHRTLVCNGNTNVASTTFVLVPSLQLSVASGLYMIDGFIVGNIVTSCAPFIKINSPSVSNMMVGVLVTYSSGTGEDTFNSNITAAGGSSSSPTVLLPSSTFCYITFRGSAVFTGSGTLSISIATGTSAGNWTVQQGSFMNVFPV